MFEAEETQLRGLLVDLRATIEAGETTSASLNTTIESFERLTTVFTGGEGSGRSDRRPFDILDYQSTAESLTTAAEELNRLATSMHALLDSPNWEARGSQIGDASDRVQVSLDEVIDRGFQRGLILIGVLVVGGFVAAVAYRLVAVRLIAPRRL
ncbi:MAG: hypothetical protein GY715_02010 [Planctomycetes bacterium]|nr:hypothetical protein [Planctomycetota bacterium]